MDLKGAEIRNIHNLCGDMSPNAETKPINVIIPFYQRPYKWTKDHISRLVDDFFENNCNEYFVGSVVMITPNREDDETHFSVIDGQQRITTLFLAEYLKFLLLRSYVETLISIKRTTKLVQFLSTLDDTSNHLFGCNIANRFNYAHSSIVDRIDKEKEEKKDDSFFKEVLQSYQESVYLPERDFSDINTYTNNSKNLIRDFLELNECDLSLTYRRLSYITKLKTALSSIAVKVTDSEKLSMHSSFDRKDAIVSQYVNAISYIFNSVCSKIPYISGQTEPLDYAFEIINALDAISKNIKLCVIITGNEKDAYTLFEVLNDRALEIDDIDLIKNLFYKWYCNYSSENDAAIDSYIETADKIWVEEVFTPGTGVGKTKMISFLAAEYLTADPDLKYADKEKYRETIEDKYLKKHIENDEYKYTKADISNDILVYQMVSKIITTFGFAFSYKNEEVIKAEISNYSITYRALHLLNALNQYGVMPAITNAIIKIFVNGHKNDDGIIKIDEFDEYLNTIMSDNQHTKDEYQYIYNISFVFWRLALLCKDAEVPREEAKKAISKLFSYGNSFDYVLDAEKQRKLTADFSTWMNEWKYGDSFDDIKAKVLFINLFKTSKENNKLIIRPANLTFDTSKLHLDHLEAKIPGNNRELYFFPAVPGALREDYTNSIGNMMILDQANNNEKDNIPLQPGLVYYDHMCANHWLITEINTLINQEDCFDDRHGTHVPKEKFFSERRERLTKYFKAILNKGLYSNEMQID